ncbi:MAG: hypothetical protein K0U37_07660 [Gammaproteobacteria bacterium]|nr:hypothetical protein [Gammaproteobacteria bacterium]
MQLLFYIRQAAGEKKCIVKHFEYQYEDELDREMKAFFEISGSSRCVQDVPSAFMRVDNIIESLETTLPYVREGKVIELIDRATFRGQNRDIHTYLKRVDIMGKKEVPCAFATFERFKVTAPLLHHIFDMIGDENKPEEDILNIRESGHMKP